MSVDAVPESELERAFRLQGEARERERFPSRAWREDAIRRLLATIETRRDTLAAALHADFAKPAAEVDVTEILVVLGHGRHALKHVGRWMRPRRVATPLTLFGTRSHVRPEPRGRALVLAPWNYPVDLTFGPLFSALAAGNRAILKPSEKCPRTSDWMKAVITDCFDESEVALVTGDADVARSLIELPFDHVFFTGSTAVGRLVRRAVSEHDCTLTLELGGKSPAIVERSADVADAARKIVWGKFTNAGQTCIAPDHVLVDEAVADDLVSALADAITRSYGERPAESPDLARVIDDAAFERLARLLDDARARGARCVVGGDVDASERYVSPTVLTDVPRDSLAMTEEIFGPILPVVRTRDLDEALASARSRPVPLASYLFTRDERCIERFLERCPAGGSSINETLLHYVHPALPFGGVGASGSGRAHGRHGFDTFSNLRGVLRSSFLSRNATLLAPPFGARTRRVVELVRRWL